MTKPDINDVEVGAQYLMPQGMVDVEIVQIDATPGREIRLRLKNLTGKRVGNCRWESLSYFLGLAAERAHR